MPEQRSFGPLNAELRHALFRHSCDHSPDRIKSVSFANLRHRPGSAIQSPTGAPMGLRIIQVDAFTDQPFKGNPAAVCLLPEPRDDSWMQLVAREMNLSETAFLLGREGGFG